MAEHNAKTNTDRLLQLTEALSNRMAVIDGATNAVSDGPAVGLSREPLPGRSDARNG